MSAPYRNTFTLPYTSTGSVNSGWAADLAALDLLSGVQVASGATDAVAIREGSVFITTAGVDALTLFTPVAGQPSAGGDDGRALLIKSTTAHAHTVTTAANVINGADDTITFGGAVTDYIHLIAYNAKWWALASSGATLSEV
jgi:hypothetical protein